MGISVSKEAFVFLCSALTGAGICLLYDIFRLLHRAGRPGGFLLQVQDVLFWVLAASVMFFVIFYVNNGSVRLYELIGAALGALLYSLTLSKWVFLIFNQIIAFFSAFFKKILKILLTPLLFMYNIMYRCIKPILRLFKRLARLLGRRFCRSAVRCGALLKKK
ncbi:MAG: hypothetical protein E7414_05550 [Ruminococcaceae bacterium]|nr:hypothetical protein [Oscillospiraceae bacterium]